MKHIVLIFCLLPLISCNDSSSSYLEYALDAAGNNRSELEKVLAHYQNDTLKHKAAIFLIENMPGHYSYAGNEINEYYKVGENILQSDLSPVQQRDSLIQISKQFFPMLKQRLVQDVSVITAEYLIKNIDMAFALWETKPWTKHLNFEEFCEFILPYKCCELQQLDSWRDTLSGKFSDDLNAMLPDDERYDSPYNVATKVRKEMQRKLNLKGMFTESGYPFLSASTMYKITYGRCTDYVTLAVATMRSLGIPVVIESTPQWGRYRAGHDWYTLLNDKGELLSSEWDITTDPGRCFFPYQRIPKIFRSTYAINRRTADYNASAEYIYPFSPFQKDVTDLYFKTSDLCIPIHPKKLKDSYAYIAVFNERKKWNIVDFGEIKRKKAHFQKMGRNVLYLVLGYDGIGLVPITYPFIVHKNGTVQYVVADTNSIQKVSLTRKYPASLKVLEMQQRILHGTIQASNRSDFANADTLYTFNTVNFPDKIVLNPLKLYRYWRYMSPAGSYGSLAELKFFKNPDESLAGKPISSLGENNDTTAFAFDDKWLTNFETTKPNGSWVGMDFGQPIVVNRVRCVPRNDENLIHVGHKYELRYWDNQEWCSLGFKLSTNNILVYDSVPKGALLWLKDRWGGWDERVFLNKNGKQEWW